MNLKTLAENLEADVTLNPRLVQAQNLFIHAFPPAAKTGVMLREYFGGTEIDHELAGYRHAPFQCIVRAPNYQAAETLAKAISASWTFEADPVANPRLMGSMSFRYLRPRNEPLVFPNSEGSLWEFLVNFEACYVLV